MSWDLQQATWYFLYEFLIETCVSNVNWMLNWSMYLERNWIRKQRLDELGSSARHLDVSVKIEICKTFKLIQDQIELNWKAETGWAGIFSMEAPPTSRRIHPLALCNKTPIHDHPRKIISLDLTHKTFICDLPHKIISTHKNYLQTNPQK